MSKLRFRIFDKKNNTYKLLDIYYLDNNGKLVVINSKDDCLNIEYAIQKDFIIEYATEIFDRKEKMIYEGDIIKMRHPYDRRYFDKFIVVKDFDSPKFGLLDETKTNEVFDLYNYMSDYYEVIGNINKNPELLEDRNE